METAKDERTAMDNNGDGQRWMEIDGDNVQRWQWMEMEMLMDE